MSRVAIILAASEYQTQGALPACKNDAMAIEKLLRATGRYDQLLVLVDERQTADAMDKLVGFVESNKGTAFEEVFFYFSGHGSYRDEEFSYILSDYDDSRPRQTSVRNSDLDQLLRQLAPKLTVKIVDACQSGVPYVKGRDAGHPPLEKHLNETGGRFSDCYFMFSSERDQNSYADSDLSHFTRAFLRCLAEADDGELRYKRLIDALGDVFENSTVQKPFYVTQGNHTETFFTQTEDVRKVLLRCLEGSASSREFSDPTVEQILSAVRRDASRFVTEEVATKWLEDLAGVFQGAILPSGIAELYDVKVALPSGTSHPGDKAIGEWLQLHGSDLFSRQRYLWMREAKTQLDSILGLAAPQPRKYETDEVEGYKHTVAMPYGHLVVSLTPKLGNLHPFRLRLVPVLSRADVRLFWSICEYEHEGWQEHRPKKTPEWKHGVFPLAEPHSADLAAAGYLQELWRAGALHVVKLAKTDKNQEHDCVERLISTATQQREDTQAPP